MSINPLCFFAYSSQPPDLVETIEATIEDMNLPGTLKVYSWKHFSTPGNIILSEVCNGIDACDVFACDLTYLNTNVLFELGYAISKGKHLWIAIDKSVAKAKENYDKLGFLSTVIHIPYHNHHELAQTLLAQDPLGQNKPTLRESIIRSAQQQAAHSPTLFYLKSEINTEASDQLTRRLKRLGVHTETDDPDEIPSQTLTWYVEHTFHSFAVIAHFLSDDRQSRLLQNQKYAFVSGLAHGFGRKLLMLAPEPFVPGMDYRDLLQKHRTAADCIKHFESWWQISGEEYHALLHEFEGRQIETKALIDLQSLNLGDHLAENERLELSDYFVYTAAYSEALQGRPTMLFVGRKGTGKTANLVELSDDLKQDPRYHVCVIEPPAYEQAAVLKLLKDSSPLIEKGYVTESIWKFLIESELAKSVNEEIRSRPPHYQPTADETEFLKYMDGNSGVLGTEFAIRMENAIALLLAIDPNQTMQAQRKRLSEILHHQILADLRRHLGTVLEKKKKVFILIDNLDKAWSVRADIPYLSNFLFGLLGVSRAISEEFGRTGHTWRRVPLSLIIFLRSDIFSRVMTEAREPDKIEAVKIQWNDPILLQRIVEERIVSSTSGRISAPDVWGHFFVAAINGIPTKDYIVSRILPRPRDMIYFCKAALASAINRRHTKIQEDDILNAEKEYSYFALYSLAAETNIEFDHMQDLLLLFAESSEILTRSHIEKRLADLGIPTSKAAGVIDLLIDSGFLGMETSRNQFEFLYDDTQSQLMRSKARSILVARKGKKQQLYRINQPYHAWLGIRRDQASK